MSDIGQACGAAGGLFFAKTPTGTSWVAAPEVRWLIEGYIAGGWMEQNVRGAPLLAEMYPGFRTDSDYRSAQERATLPVYRDFLIPNAIDAGAGTVIQGAADDAIMFVVEHFGSHDQATAAIPFLDTLRPHLARALTVSAQVSARDARVLVEGIRLLGAAAAVVGATGKVRAANRLFHDRLGNDVIDRRSRLTFLDPATDRCFAELLDRHRHGLVASKSLPLRPRNGGKPFALHIVPLRGRATNIFDSDGLLMVLAEGHNNNVPSPDLLRLLFDLTPAEARLARRLLEGDTLAEATRILGVKEATTRSHLKTIFVKSGVSRQADLIRLLAGYGLGEPADPGDHSPGLG